MCGIIGITSLTDKNLAQITVSCLEKLEYRGYDSVGVASLQGSILEVRKAKGTVKEVVQKKNILSMRGNVFLGHTRWATHGPPSDYNAHPHTDCSNSIAVIHNGTLKNFKELKESLVALGHVFRSETDTEVIPHLIEEYRKKGFDTFTAFKKAVLDLEGSYAILAIVKGENRIYFAKKDNPLVIGMGEGTNFVASDIPAFLDYTKKVVIINDGELGYVTPTSIYIEDLRGNVIDVTKRIRIIDWDAQAASKEGYPHFMLKEIHESARAINDTINGLLSETELVEEITERLKGSDRIIVIAAGTSYHAGLYFTILLNRLGYTALPVIASEYYNINAKRGDSVIAISQSGETIDVLMGIRKMKEKGATIISITNVIDSAISRESDYKLYMRAGPEIGVAATKTFSSQLAVLLFLYAYLAKIDYKELLSAPEVIKNSISLGEGIAKKVGEELALQKSVYYLGRGLSLPLAMEGALKIKEIAYVHAEAYPAGESKHGPIALVEKGYPVVFINDGELTDLLENNLHEMKARGAKTYAISVNKRLGAETEILIKVDKDILSPFAISPIIQLIAYYASTAKSLDPDRPRNLAKTVTVE